MSTQVQRRRPRAAALLLSFAAAWILAGLGAAPVAAAGDIRIVARIGDCGFRGINAGALRTVKIEWRRSFPDGELKSKHSVKSNAAGQFTTRCEPGEEIEIGDQLGAKVGTGDFLFQHVPPLTARINRDANTVFVRMYAAQADLTIDLYTWNGTFHQLTLDTHEVSTPPIGWMTEEFPEADIGGYDFADVTWQDVHGDLFIRTVTAPGITAWIGRAYVEAVGNPGMGLDLRLRDGTGFQEYGRTGGYLWEGNNGFFVYNQEAQRVQVGVGDRVDAYLSDPQFGDSYAGFVVPRIQAYMFKGNDTVRANCGSSAVGIDVVVYARDGTGLRSRAGWSDGLLGFTANFAQSPKRNIVSGDKVDIYCRFNTGDVIAKRFTVP